MKNKNVKFNRISAFLIATVFILTMSPVFATETEITLSGNGTAETPYLIGTEAELIEFRELVEADADTAEGKTSKLCGKLTADIRLASAWVPIITSSQGNTGCRYAGTFDGDGHTISNMTAFMSGVQGLVGEAGAGLVIKNLTVEGTYDLTGQTSTAGFVGRANGGAIEFINCINKVDVTGTQQVSGFIGDPRSFTHQFTNCANYGDITGTTYVNGFMAGSGSANYAVFTNCANYGDIVGNHGNEFVAGICRTGTFRNCIGYGSVKNTASNGLASAIAHNVAASENCFFRANAATATTTTKIGTSKTAAKFESGEVAYLLNGSSSENITWGQQLGVDAYPIYGKTNYPIYSVDGKYSNVNEPFGTVTNPYLIGTETDLKAFKTAADADGTVCAKLTKDIALESAWTGIGSSTTPFTGTFDGNGHTISNMTAAVYDTQGLVAVAGEGLVIKNLTVEGTYNKYGQTNTAGFVGKASGAVEFINCTNKVNVSGGNYIGGFIGAGSHAHEFTNCANYGNIIGNSAYSGGFVAEGNSSSAVFTNCANYGNIVGNYSYTCISGISTKGKFTNCVGYGSVENQSGPASATFNGSAATETNCYYRSGANIGGTAVKGGTSRTADQFASGQVTYEINVAANEIIYGQDLPVDTYPVLGKDSMVYNNADSYSNDEGIFLSADADNALLAATEGAVGYIAKYEANGKLIGVEHITITGQLKNRPISQGSAAYVKVLLWNADMKPLCNGKTINF